MKCILLSKIEPVLIARCPELEYTQQKEKALSSLVSLNIYPDVCMYTCIQICILSATAAFHLCHSVPKISGCTVVHRMGGKHHPSAPFSIIPKCNSKDSALAWIMETASMKYHLRISAFEY